MRTGVVVSQHFVVVFLFVVRPCFVAGPIPSSRIILNTRVRSKCEEDKIAVVTPSECRFVCCLISSRVKVRKQLVK